MFRHFRITNRIHIGAGLVLILTILALTGQALAITWGEPDADNTYSNVGAIVLDRPEREPSQFCTGTLIAPTVFLTAGHCTDYLEELISEELITQAMIKVSFDPEDIFDPEGWIEIAQIVTHPQYGTSEYNNPHDVALLILAAPVNLPPARLPVLGYLEQLKRDKVLGDGPEKAQFIVAGYGTTIDWPPPEVLDNGPNRWFAYSEYRAIMKPWLLMSQNHIIGNAGTCFGDSGGPAFIDYGGELVLVGITSWGDSNCVATGFDYRVDIAETLDFIGPFINP